jgi:hypothetical protein
MKGDQTAVALALEQAPDDDGEEQLPLPDLIGADAQRLDTGADAERRGPGRPPGARNRRTLEMANYLLSRYASPLEILAQIATARVDDLKRDIGCTRLEALQEKRLAALALLPYVHQKMPVAVDVTNRNVVHLNIVVEETAAPDAPEDTLTARVLDAIAQSDADGTAV